MYSSVLINERRKSEADSSHDVTFEVTNGSCDAHDAPRDLLGIDTLRVGDYAISERKIMSTEKLSTYYYYFTGEMWILVKRDVW